MSKPAHFRVCGVSCGIVQFVKSTAKEAISVCFFRVFGNKGNHKRNSGPGFCGSTQYHIFFVIYRILFPVSIASEQNPRRYQAEEKRI